MSASIKKKSGLRRFNSWVASRKTSQPDGLEEIQSPDEIQRYDSEPELYGKSDTVPIDMTSGVDSDADEESRPRVEEIINTDVHEAVRLGDKSKIKALLRRHPKYIRARDAEGNTPLHIASESGQMEIVELLLKYSPDVDSQNLMGVMSVHLAIMHGHSTIVDVLTYYNADRKRRRGLSSATLTETSSSKLPKLARPFTETLSSLRSTTFLKRTQNTVDIRVGSNGSLAFQEEETIEDILKQVWRPNLITMTQRNRWTKGFLEKVEFIFSSSLNYRIKIGLRITVIGDNVEFTVDGETLDLVVDRKYGFWLEPSQQDFVAVTAQRKCPQSGKPETMGFAYCIGYKRLGQWNWVW